MRGFLPALIALGLALTLLGCITPPRPTPTPGPTATPFITPTPAAGAINLSAAALKSFRSWEEVRSFLEAAPAPSYRYYGRGGIGPLGAVPLAAPVAAGTAEARDFSTTNVQVEGVDEADIMKNDGTYLYTLSNGRIVILPAYPPAEAKVLSVIGNATFTGLFVNGDKLVAFGQREFPWDDVVKPLEASATPAVARQDPARTASFNGLVPPYPRYYSQSYFIRVYDLSDRSSPRLLKSIDSRGSYVGSRMIGTRVYAFFTEYAYPGLPRPMWTVDGKVRALQPTEIAYIDYPFDSYQFTTVLGLDLADLAKEESRRITLTGSGQALYVSPQNAYLAHTRYPYYQPAWPVYEQIVVPFMNSTFKERIQAASVSDASEWRRDRLRVKAATDFLDSAGEPLQSILRYAVSERESAYRERPVTWTESTVIHKFSLGPAINYEGRGEVPGHVLNQFSMDEFGDRFRLATTTGEVSRFASPRPSRNNVYVLNAALNITGRLEGLAPGEKIYSARFLGKRAYLVTFKKVDPLFTIGFDDPDKPALLGKLKIPGYSDYLHPYDETHLIGLGKDAVPAEEGDFAWYQGLKLTLFDVSDVANPRELATQKIGDRGSDSYALHDHRAFLFSRARNLLVIPVLLAEIERSKYPQGVTPQTYGDFTFQGAYVFNVTLAGGFQPRGRISHADPELLRKSGEYYYGEGTNVQRSAYINEFLYTLSERLVKANRLDTLSEAASVQLPAPPEPTPYPVGVR